ncbi:GHKL domain-containing protein [candidate division KSB1 bacterium]|nr:GHKL domain-containing protein [candidate division KSB1 bacterium]
MIKHFRIQCTFRVLLLTITVGLLFYIWFQFKMYNVVVIGSSMVIFQVYALIRYVEKTNRQVNRFLDAIKYEDFSQSFSGTGLGSSFDELKASFTDVLNKFKQTRAEKEEHYRYLQTVVQHVGIGLISFQTNGHVELINAAAKRLLKVSQIRNIKSLTEFSPELVQTMLAIRPGEKALLKIQDGDELLQLAVYAIEFVLRQQKIRLVSIQNIQSELEEQEMEAWQKLIRVLTHEIMNSVTPIASLAGTVNEMLTEVSFPDNACNEEHHESIDDIRSAVKTIEKRSQGLINFVESYRQLTRIPRPDFKIYPVRQLFNEMLQLIGAQHEDKTIEFTISVEPQSLELTADPELIEQVLINLLNNAIYAVKEKPDARIELIGRMDDRGRTALQVADNGVGIVKEVQEKIFIPFFTTKREGSGIGLSLSRQIMRMHRGTISVHSELHKGTVFTLRF